MSDKMLRATSRTLDEVLVVPVSSYDSELRFNHGELDGKRGVVVNVRHENGITSNHYFSVDEFLALGTRTEILHTKERVDEFLM